MKSCHDFPFLLLNCVLSPFNKHCKKEKKQGIVMTAWNDFSAVFYCYLQLPAVPKLTKHNTKRILIQLYYYSHVKNASLQCTTNACLHWIVLGIHEGTESDGYLPMQNSLH